MKTLAIETSCDETAIAILKGEGENNLDFKVLANEVDSQIDLHREYGGVYPSLAKREHAKNILPICINVLEDANLLEKETNKLSEEQKEYLEELLAREPELRNAMVHFFENYKKPEIDFISVTTGPGLEPALWIGIMEGHVLSILIDELADDETKNIDLSKFKFPALALLISGGHTELVVMKDWLDYKKIGATRDDAVGEAFDKVARVLGLPYPGGPEISRIAIDGKENEQVKLPRPMINTDDYDFSFSGLKTAVLYLTQELGDLNEQIKSDIAREFENSVAEVLVEKTMKAVNNFDIKSVTIGGGVAANRKIRESICEALNSEFPETKLYLPIHKLSTDNAIMIGIAGYFQYLRNRKGADLNSIRAFGNLKL